MPELKHILFASNLDKSCDKKLTKVMGIAKVTGAKITVLHVVKPVLAAYASPDLFESYDLEGTLTNDAKKKLEKYAQSADFPINQTIVINGHPATTIMEQAEKLDCQLIVLNGHTHSVFGRLGSTADAIINRAHCDVLILREHR